jgi:hypothetical protein
MAARPTTSALSLLTWLKDRQPGVSTALDAAEYFGSTPEMMQRILQSLQRYECVKRMQRDRTGWLITEQGLVRLAEGRFSPGGSFLSRFDETPRNVTDADDRPDTVVEGTSHEAVHSPAERLWPLPRQD